MKTKNKLFVMMPVVLMLFVALFALQKPQEAHAIGGFGSVWSTDVQDTEITLAWTTPSGKYALATATNGYKVCYKISGTWTWACTNPNIEFSSVESITIDGLTSGEEYKFKVFCQCTKNGNNAKWRKISTYKVSTTVTPTLPETPHGSVAIVGSDPFVDISLDVEVNYSHPEIYDLIRTCYKAYGSLITLHADCKERDEITTNWGTSTDLRGWADDNTPQTTWITTFADLKACRHYKIVAYGFAPGSDVGVQIGDLAMGQACSKIHESGGLYEAFADDHVELLTEYGTAVDEFYEMPLFYHLAQSQQELHTINAILVEDGDASIRDTASLLIYMEEVDSPLFDEWQQERGLRAANLTLDGYLRTNHPNLYQQLLQDMQEISDRK